MFQSVIHRLRTPNGTGSPSESSEDRDDGPAEWGAASAGAPSGSRAPPTQPDPPSHSHTPPPELADPAVEPPRKTEELDSEQLAVLLAAADDDEEADGIIEEFGTKAGRKRLVQNASDAHAAEEEEVLDEGSLNRTVRRNRAARARGEVYTLVESDDDVTPAIIESIRMNPDETDGVTTRRGTTVGRKKRPRPTRSAPLPSKKSRKKNAFGRSSKSNENFIDKNRRERFERAVKMSGGSDDNGGLRRSTRHRSTRLRPTSPEADDEEFASDGSSERSDASLRSSGSAGARSKSDDSEYQQEESENEKALNASPGEESDDEDDETYAINKARTTRAGKRRSGRRKKTAPDNEGDDEMEVSPRRATRKQTGKGKRKAKNSKDFLGRKAKPKRRRTDPNSVFESPQVLLTHEERRERLDALVKQTADIARDLNAAMTAEKERDDAAAEALANGIGGRVAKKGTIAEGELFWPTVKAMSMQSHQVDGVRWLLTLDAQGLNAILADEMGLGKTLQSVTFLATVLAVENRGPHIVIAPKNVVPHWGQEVERWYPGMFRVVTHIGAGEERFERMNTVLRTMPDFDILVTSFDLAMRDFFTKPRPGESGGGIAWENRQTVRQMQKLEFEYAIIDEAHRLKNVDGKFTSGLRKFTQARRRLLLTGTPLSNNLQELWALMNVLNPRIFGSQGTFDAWFAAPFDTTDKRDALSINEQSLIVDRLHTVLRPFFRRRLRADVCPSYSSADEVVIRCPQSAMQKSLFKHYLETRKVKQYTVNNVLMCLRQVSNHPYVASRALFDPTYGIPPRSLVGLSGKFLFLHHALPRLIVGGHRVLIFSQFRRTLDFLEDLMEHLHLKFGRLDGMTSNESRDDIVERFNAPGSDIPVFLLTTRAGGVGLNLQSADTVILFDSDWSPSADLQAVSRIQRIGQKRTVHIMRLVTHNSIDEFIVDKGKEKLRTEAVAIGAGKFNANVDPAADCTMRQRDLEALLAEYEAKQDRRSPEADYANVYKLEDGKVEAKANGTKPDGKAEGPIELDGLATANPDNDKAKIAEPTKGPDSKQEDTPKPSEVSKAEDAPKDVKAEEGKAEQITSGVDSGEKKPAGGSNASDKIVDVAKLKDVDRDGAAKDVKNDSTAADVKIGKSDAAVDDKKQPAKCDATQTFFEQVSPQLLRNGETSLPPAQGTPLSLIEAIDEVPHWARPGFDLRCTALALKCQMPSAVPAALEKAMLKNAEKRGDLPKKRERRTRFNFKHAFDNMSGSDDGDDEFVQALESPSDSDDQFDPNTRVDSPGKKRGPKKKAPPPVSLPPSMAHGSNHLYAGNFQGAAAANAGFVQHPHVGAQVPMNPFAFIPGYVHGNTIPNGNARLVPKQETGAAGPNGTTPTKGRPPQHARVIAPRVQQPSRLFAQESSSTPQRKRETVSAAGVPTVDLVSDSEDEPVPKPTPRPASYYGVVSGADAEKMRKQQLHLRAVAIAEQRMAEKDARRNAERAKQKGANGAGSQQTPLQMQNAATEASKQLKSAGASSGSTAGSRGAGGVAAQTGAAASSDPVAAVRQASPQQPTSPALPAPAGNVNAEANVVSTINVNDVTIAHEIARGVDPAMITSLQEFTGVLDRELLVDVLVQCNNDVATAAHYIMSCE